MLNVLKNTFKNRKRWIWCNCAY